MIIQRIKPEGIRKEQSNNVLQAEPRIKAFYGFNFLLFYNKSTEIIFCHDGSSTQSRMLIFFTATEFGFLIVLRHLHATSNY